MSTTTSQQDPPPVLARPRVKIPTWRPGPDTGPTPTTPTSSSPPTSPDPTLPPPEEGTSPGPRPLEVDDDGARAEPSTLTRGRGARPTTSSGGERPTVSAAAVATTLGKLLLVLAGLAGWVASRRGGWDLRVPDDDETDDVAEPLARILTRHCGTRFLTDDLVDGVQAAAGVVSYVETSPLRRTHEARAEPGDEVMPEGMEPIS